MASRASALPRVDGGICHNNILGLFLKLPDDVFT